MKLFHLSTLALLLSISFAAAAGVTTLEIKGGGNLGIGQSSRLIVTARDDAGQTVDAPSLKWKSSNPLSVSVNEEGQLTIRRIVKKSKPVIISVSDGSHSASVNITSYGLGFIGGTYATYAPDGTTVKSVNAAGYLEVQLPEGVTTQKSPEVLLIRPDGTIADYELFVYKSADYTSRSFIDTKSVMKGVYRVTVTIGGVNYVNSFEINPELLAPPTQSLNISLAKPGVLKVDGILPPHISSIDLDIFEASKPSEVKFFAYQSDGDGLPTLVKVYDAKDYTTPNLKGNYTYALTSYNYSRQNVLDGNLPEQVLVSYTPLTTPFTIR